MRKNLNLIQFSRALVPLLVLLFHANEFMIAYFNVNVLGFAVYTASGGVNYFFALSGFMVYYLYHKKFGNLQALKDFLYKRFIRIFPVYWIITLCILPIYFVFPGFGNGTEREVAKIITSLLLMPTGMEPILGVAWSLVHTVYFYFMFSLFFLKNKIMINVFHVVWAVISLLFSIGILSNSHYLINFLFNFNNIIFILGVACAYLVLKVNLNYYVSMLFVVLGVSGFPLAWFNSKYLWVDVSLQVMTSFASVFLIIGLASIDLQKEIKIPRFAKYLGDASFSIYLIHKVALSVICRILSLFLFFSIHYIVAEMIIIVFAAATGCIVYSIIEKPINKKLKSQFIRNPLPLRHNL